LFSGGAFNKQFNFFFSQRKAKINNILNGLPVDRQQTVAGCKTKF